VHVKKKTELVKVFSQLVSSLSDKEKRELFETLLGRGKEHLPISIFRSNLSGLEAIVVYLRDVKEQSSTEIAKLLNRKRSTIYTTYQKAKQKLTGSLDCSDVSVTIPLQIFTDRKFSILESLTHYLKDECEFSIVKITKLLNKKYSTVRTVYRRYQTKCR